MHLATWNHNDLTVRGLPGCLANVIRPRRGSDAKAAASLAIAVPSAERGEHLVASHRRRRRALGTFFSHSRQLWSPTTRRAAAAEVARLEAVFAGQGMVYDPLDKDI